MHAVIIIFISIVLTLLLFTLSRSLFCSLVSEKKIHDINTQANFLLKFWKCDLNIFCRNFFQRNVSHMILFIKAEENEVLVYVTLFTQIM